MKVHDFLSNHGVSKNPFAEEDAQTDPVFKQYCIQSAYHPAWDKIFGDPHEPATSIVFGEKGAGKTAMRLQINKHLQEYNKTHPDQKLFVINYDDFNPFLDRFVTKLSARRRRIDKALGAWRLWDHMDAILSLGVTQLVERLTNPGASPVDEVSPASLGKLDRHQKSAVLLLASFYDHSIAQPAKARWSRLLRVLKVWPIKTWLPFMAGLTSTILVAAGGISLAWFSSKEDASQTVTDLWNGIPVWVYVFLIFSGWCPWMLKWVSRFFMAQGVAASNRVGGRTAGQIQKSLMYFLGSQLSGQPMPNKERTDDRYELFDKFQNILRTLGYSGVFVLVDRVDEPHAINGSPDLMRQLIWPMLDNKFLKHQGIGVKLMLPAELKYFVDREDRDFVQRARLDKQNLVPSLAWTGEALFDVANARMSACAANGATPKITELFSDRISREHLIDSFRSLRVPRHLHKFLYRLIVAHCNGHTEENPTWEISKEQFETELAMYQRELEG